MNSEYIIKQEDKSSYYDEETAINKTKNIIIKFGYLYKRSKFLRSWRR